MNANFTYTALALDWQPAGSSDKRFYTLMAFILAVMLFIGFLFSSINIPKKERRIIAQVPARVAQFIAAKPHKVKLKPEIKPKAVITPKPKARVKKQIIKKSQQQRPLTKLQKKARKKAEQTGLLALGSELAELIDTTQVSAQLSGRISGSASNSAAASHNKELVLAGAIQGSGGVDSDQYMTAINSRTQLSERQQAEVRETLLSGNIGSAVTGKPISKSRHSKLKARTEEEVTIVFDQNKGKLYSIYNRARRTTPGLKGKIILEITISPSGHVTYVKIVSSELENPKLERRLLARVKQFTFGTKKVETMVVTFPIEFLPS